MKGEIRPGGFLSKYGSLLALLVLGVLAFVFLMAAFLYPITQWDRAKTAGGQYYTYLTAFNKDLNELEFLSQQYNYAPLRETAFERKASAAANYSARAKEAVTSWGYFQSFIRQNEGSLRKWNVDTAAALAKIESGRSVVKGTSGSMAGELERFAATLGPDARERSSAAVNDLRALSA